MGKKAKEHRRKVEKRNKKINQEKYVMKKQIDKLFEQRIGGMSPEDISVKLNDKDLPFNIIEDNGIFPNTKLNEEVKSLDFTDSNNDQFVDIEITEEEPMYDSAGYTIDDREVDVDTTSEPIKVSENND